MSVAGGLAVLYVFPVVILYLFVPQKYRFHAWLSLSLHYGSNLAVAECTKYGDPVFALSVYNGVLCVIAFVWAVYRIAKYGDPLYDW